MLMQSGHLSETGMMMTHVFMGQYSWEKKKMEKQFKIRHRKCGPAGWNTVQFIAAVTFTLTAVENKLCVFENAVKVMEDDKVSNSVLICQINNLSKVKEDVCVFLGGQLPENRWQTHQN